MSKHRFRRDIFFFIIEEQSNLVPREVRKMLFFSQERKGEGCIRKVDSMLCGKVISHSRQGTRSAMEEAFLGKLGYGELACRKGP